MEIKPALLVVDDELGARESLEVILEDDFHVLTAESGQEALQIVQKEAVESGLPEWKPWSNTEGLPKTILLDADFNNLK